MRGPLRLIMSAPPQVQDPLYRAAGQMPAFDLRFENGSMVDAIGGITPTFTRPSSKKLAWNGSQFVEYAADVPAFQVDPATDRRGYLHEPAATNLFLNSATPATQGITVTAQAYTLSFYGTGTITLSGTSTAGPLVGTGAEPNRVSLTFTPTAGTLTLTVSGTISKPQLETGPVATSPIVTAGSAVTRTADTMTVSGADFSSWFNQDGGVFYAEFSRSFPVAISADHGRIIAAPEPNNTILGTRAVNRAETWNGSNALDTTASFTVGLPSKAAISYSAAGRSLTLNGAVPVSNANLFQTVASLVIGARSSGLNSHNGIIHRLAYFPPGAAQSRIQQMTA
jgi:hypothetical protein